MRSLSYSGRTFRLTQLHDELLAALPALRPIATPDGAWTNVSIAGDESTGELELIVPESVSQAQIDAVLAVHEPAPVADPVDPAAEADAILDAGGSAEDALRALLGHRSPPNASKPVTRPETKAELVERAEAQGVAGAAKLSKAELLSAIYSKQQLAAIASTVGVAGGASLAKAKLAEALAKR